MRVGDLERTLLLVLSEALFSFDVSFFSQFLSAFLIESLMGMTNEGKLLLGART